MDMVRPLLLIISLAVHFNGIAQIHSTKEGIQSFIDSIGRSDDRELITTSIFPAYADGTNFKWSNISGETIKKNCFG